MENKKEILSYDYRTVKVKRQVEAMVTDAYEALGWELVGSSVSEGGIFNVNLSFKRDRKIENKQHLLKLQEKIDSVLLNIEILQNRKKSAGLASSIITGTAGTLTFGGGMSMIMEFGVAPVVTGWLVGGIALGVIGLGICALAWLVNKKVKRAKIAKIDPLLDVEFNKLGDLCEQAKEK